MKPQTRAAPRRAPSRRSRFAWVIAAPTMDDLSRLLSAWRMWILGGVVGALVGAAVYAAAPPPYRARATVNVDFHLEQAWPHETDREQFYYLERETRKLIEIAYSDRTLSAVSHSVPGATIQALRMGAAQLSQPGNGGWHFYGIDQDSRRAELIASSWARNFAQDVMEQVRQGEPGGLEPYITADVTQGEFLPVERTAELGAYMLAAALATLLLAALGALMLHRRA